MKTQFGKLVQESDICVLCGKKVATTREHIPPQSLFLIKPREYLTVPACEECNKSTALEDEYLRQITSAATFVGMGRKVWEGKVVPKFLKFPKTQSGLREQLTTSPVTIGTFGTINLPALKIDEQRFRLSIQKLVCGFYWLHSGLILPSATKLDVHFLNAAYIEEHFDKLENEKIFSMTRPGVYRDPDVMDIFFYTGKIFRPEASLWYFFFYKQNAVIAVTGSQI